MTAEGPSWSIRFLQGPDEAARPRPARRRRVGLLALLLTWGLLTSSVAPVARSSAEPAARDAQALAEPLLVGAGLAPFTLANALPDWWERRPADGWLGSRLAGQAGPASDRGAPAAGLPGAGVPGVTGLGAVGGGAVGPTGVSRLMLAAYQNAERLSGTLAPGCSVRWSVLAGLGKVESNHGRNLGSIATGGDVYPAILGPRLDGGPGVAAIRDTDSGRWDGDRLWDRAVGPMQFIPSSWRLFGKDGNGDGIANPHNAYDAALAAAAHLCSSRPGDYRERTTLSGAIFGYNRSLSYVATVLRWVDAYDGLAPTPLTAAPLPAAPQPIVFPPPPVPAPSPAPAPITAPAPAAPAPVPAPEPATPEVPACPTTELAGVVAGLLSAMNDGGRVGLAALLADEDGFRWSSLTGAASATLPVLLDELGRRADAGEAFTAGGALAPRGTPDGPTVVDVPVIRSAGGQAQGVLRLSVDCSTGRVQRLAMSWAEPTVVTAQPEDTARPQPETGTATASGR